MRPVLFLDEIDKVRGSDYKMEKLRAIVDAVYEAQGQIVATSNTDPESIAAKWGGEWADIILRRIAAPPEGMVLQFQVAE
jgi:DNA replication protein DnaC